MHHDILPPQQTNNNERQQTTNKKGKETKEAFYLVTRISDENNATMVPGPIHFFLQQDLRHHPLWRGLDQVHNGTTIRTLEVADILTDLDNRLGIPVSTMATAAVVTAPTATVVAAAAVAGLGGAVVCALQQLMWVWSTYTPRDSVSLQREEPHLI